MEDIFCKKYPFFNLFIIFANCKKNRKKCSFLQRIAYI
jgi:hypothetical protein